MSIWTACGLSWGQEERTTCQYRLPTVDSGVFGVRTQTLKITCFAVRNKEKKDPEGDVAAYSHVLEGDITILDPSAESDSEADESVMLVFDPDF